MARVSHGKFSYDVDTFYVEASGHLHRRAIPAELRAIFNASIPDRNQRPDHPAHWFEAQLLHYGLSPSKVKATAKMRLLDAIQDDILEVPIELVLMEKRLKKEWKRQDTAARSLLSGLPNPTIDDTTTTTTTETITRNTVTTFPSVSRKRGRDIEGEEVGEGPSVKQTARRRGVGRASVPNNTTQSTGVQPQERQRPALPNQARRRQGSGDTAPPLQTARRRVTRQVSGAWTATNGNFGLSGRIGQIGIRSSTPSYRDDREIQDYDDCYDDEYFGDYSDPFDDQNIVESHHTSVYNQDPFDDRYPSSGSYPVSANSATDSYGDPRGPPPLYEQTLQAQPSKRRLGLLNGEYDIAFDEPTGNLFNANGPRVHPKICLTLNWDEIFGSLKLGILDGILWMPERPKRASEEKVPFQWHGKVSGQLFVGYENSGWIQFLGDGQIEGEISCFLRYKFQGQRTSGENASPARSAHDLRREWQGYIDQVNEAG
ncbi:DNA-repair protein UmuC-like N-terminal [Penicillium canescens]|uniref:DNA-repair protein UmuC-like N-terminal n=1 Tax=Penicillium canescens TaxID=5083 RepID=A0AAD6NCX3_PENCN|nr:DNA-repair protein UmuC-like N-terminal [Penicillium canescens]KAJ6049755.1 DNA-repair protein UmuC-like N-terminal [Penicillium canescens]KAJ6052274.1 DNA-repair protein UmuC-like N-terminal [Penicillium canescens]KAJ6062797.1 DNA-repair protein UmuC-like N-terminal [Penicillium canescens]